jgi:hypothetical protein
MRVEKGRVGLFLLFIGLISLVIFFTASRSEDPGYQYFFVGLLFSVLGIALIWRGRKPPQETRRFRIFRRQKGKAEQESSREQ